jgi:transcriptional regulator with XRE-family HTH domain
LELYTSGAAGPTASELRRKGGQWLKQLRLNAGLSQRRLSHILRLENYRFISQLETGRGRIPPDRYQEWARALKVDEQEFVRTLLSYYDPITYRVLFGTGHC